MDLKQQLNTETSVSLPDLLKRMTEMGRFGFTYYDQKPSSSAYSWAFATN